MNDEEDLDNCIAYEFRKQLESDDEPDYKKDYHLEVAYKENPEVVDMVLIALCGFSYTTLEHNVKMKKQGTIE